MLLIVAMIEVLLVSVVEWFRPARTEAGDTARNLGLWAFSATLNLLVFDGVRAAERTWMRSLEIPHLDLAAMPFLVGAAIFVLAADLVEYVAHRLQHAIPVLWRLHSLHHSDPCMNVTTAKRHHWGTVLFGFLLGTPVLAVLLRPTIGQVLCFNVASLWVYICHANLNLHLGPLNYVLNSPNNHRIHHSREAEHYNRNFANIFSFWDVITGAYLDPSHALPSTGLRTRPRHIGEALVWPLLQASKG